MSHRGVAAKRLLRLAPAALAAYELHSLIGSVAHAGAAVHWLSALNLGSASAWIMLGLALGVGFLLRESTRGLVAVLALGALVAGTLGDHAQLLTDGFGSLGAVAAIPMALLAGLVIADVVCAVRWALRRLAQLCLGPPDLSAGASPLWRLAPAWPPGLAPLHAGWSDRGPPTAALAAV